MVLAMLDWRLSKAYLQFCIADLSGFFCCSIFYIDRIIAIFTRCHGHYPTSLRPRNADWGAATNAT